MRSSSRSTLLAAILLCLLLAGCTAPTKGAQETGPPGGDCSPDVTREHVILVVGTHANMPRPVLTSSGGIPTRRDVSCALDHVLREGGELTVIGVDGAPTPFTRDFPPISSVVNTENTPGTNRVMRDHRSELEELLSLTARTEGADLHRALDLVLCSVAGAPEESVVLVLDNGLSDRGAVDLTKEGWSTAEPSDVVAAVTQSGQRLHPSPGTTVVLSGLASTAPPQPELNTVQERVVTAIWDALLRETGAKVRVDVKPWSMGDANPTELETGVVEPVRPKIGDPREGEGMTKPVVLDPGSVFFAPDEADPELTDDAVKVLQAVAEHPLDRQGTRLYVIGRTDSVPPLRWDSNVELSQTRADAVRDLLVGLGVDAERVVAVGQGYAACPDDGGVEQVDPGRRSQNRVVVIGELAPEAQVPTGCFFDQPE